MRTCQCTLPYTNPNACKGCSNNNEAGEFNSSNIPTWPKKEDWPQDWTYQELKKPYKRTVTEYDKDGKITKVTVEEFEQAPFFPSWLTSPISTGDTTSTITVTGDNHVNAT